MPNSPWSSTELAVGTSRLHEKAWAWLLSTLFSDEIIHTYLPFSFFLYPYNSFLPASVGQSCFIRPSSKCAIVFFLFPRVTLEIFFFYTTSITFLFSIQNLLCVFSISYIICLCPGCLYKFFFFAAHDFCPLLIWFPSFFFLLSFPPSLMINDNLHSTSCSE